MTGTRPTAPTSYVAAVRPDVAELVDRLAAADRPLPRAAKFQAYDRARELIRLRVKDYGPGNRQLPLPTPAALVERIVGLAIDSYVTEVHL